MEFGGGRREPHLTWWQPVDIDPLLAAFALATETGLGLVL